MTGAELAKGFHNAVSAMAEGYGAILQVVMTENAALRAKCDQQEATIQKFLRDVPKDSDPRHAAAASSPDSST